MTLPQKAPVAIQFLPPQRVLNDVIIVAADIAPAAEKSDSRPAPTQEAIHARRLVLPGPPPSWPGPTSFDA